MFLEPHFRGQRSGWIEAICGSMFSGKTEELIRRLRRAEIAGQRVGVFKPRADVRYHAADVVSHAGRAIEAVPVGGAREVWAAADGLEVVGIDEAQFLGDDLPGVCEDLAEAGRRVIVAGLDLDFRGRPFGPVPAVLAVAEYITKVHAICAQCGNLATHSYRTAAEGERVLLGAGEAYEARCRHCFRAGAMLPFARPGRTAGGGVAEQPTLL